MEFAMNSAGDGGVLTLEGNLTIERADEFKEILLRSLESTDCLTVNLEKVIEADLSCLQLLCSAHKSAKKLNKQLILNCKESELFKQLVHGTGYCRTENRNINCMWSGGTE